MNDRTRPLAFRKLSRKGHQLLGLVLAIPMVVMTFTGVLLLYPQVLDPGSIEITAMGRIPGEEARLLRGTDQGLEASTDQGKTWSEVPMLIPPGPIRRIMANTARPGQVIVLGRDGLVLSRDGGYIWEAITPGDSSFPGWQEVLDLGFTASGTPILFSQRGAWHAGPDGILGDYQYLGGPAAPSRWPQLVKDLHTGRIFGTAGAWALTAGAVLTLLLLLSGILLILALQFRRRRDA